MALSDLRCFYIEPAQILHNPFLGIKNYKLKLTKPVTFAQIRAIPVCETRRGTKLITPYRLLRELIRARDLQGSHIKLCCNKLSVSSSAARKTNIGSRAQRLATIAILTLSIGFSVQFAEASSVQGDPENLASAISFTNKVESALMYCFVDIEFFVIQAQNIAAKA
ncbi:hypothetical protein GFM09_28515 [Rhizobium leguminosarum bv. viciae]|uniref:hypothetical protein n=1 Tax=Rhizobium leguminosarum TaxID=384 RepID=UPI0014423E59|nr:hypothetical protein [Rhizobium leguminosarum]MBY5474674.1 hypothetical protein [Rhizobium leguminosarum]NKL73135.1 hypothetical protein [Rhizobium leguminosarum bv. viciae]